MGTLLKPELCYVNFCDVRMNPTFSLTLGYAGTDPGWDAANKNLLYDNRVDRRLVTTTAVAGTTSTTIVLDMGATNNVYIDVIKLLRMNFKNFSISYCTHANFGTYTNIVTVDSYNKTSYSYNIPSTLSGVIHGYTQIDDVGNVQIITSEDTTKDLRYFIAARGVKITATACQDYNGATNYNRWIGELYIGRTAMKYTYGNVLNFEENTADYKKNITQDYEGIGHTVRGRAAFKCSLIFKELSNNEFQFTKYFSKFGGAFAFFPTGGVYGSELANGFSIDDIYLVTSNSTFSINPWGQSANDIIQLDLMETKYAY